MNARLAPMPDDAYVRPWPLHPQPLPGEVLSSWLARICELYPHIKPSDLLADLDIDCPVEDLDRYTPEPVLVALAGRGAVWFRLLRTVVDEVSSPLVRTGRWATRLGAIWRAAGRSRPLRTAWVPFEDLHWDEQATVLEAAAIGIALVESGEIDAGGAHASLLRPRPYEPVDPGTAPTRSSYPAPERDLWADAHAAAEAANAAARVDPASASSLYNFLRWGCRTAAELDETVQLFLDHGIPLQHPPT